MQHTLKVDLGERAYPIIVGSGLLQDPAHLLPWLQKRSVMLVTNTTVHALYGQQLEQLLESSGCKIRSVVLPDGEVYKSWEQIETILSQMLAAQLDRKSI